MPSPQFLTAALLALAAVACTPRVQLEAPKEPIVINLNVKIEHEVRVRVDRELEDLFQERGELFEGAPAPAKEGTQ
jgi:hypothetical protein